MTIQKTFKSLADRDSLGLTGALLEYDRADAGKAEGRKRRLDLINFHREFRHQPTSQPSTPTGTHISHHTGLNTGTFTKKAEKAHAITNELSAPISFTPPRRELSMRPV